jgi:hypothetical protein
VSSLTNKRLMSEICALSLIALGGWFIYTSVRGSGSGSRCDPLLHPPRAFALFSAPGSSRLCASGRIDQSAPGLFAPWLVSCA